VIDACTLSELARRTPARVVHVEPAHASRLAALGLRPGSLLSVEQDAPLGGPRIVRLGTARLALARAVTRGIRVHPVGAPGAGAW
jgi:Fe2+ transport system protein FeoA